MNPILSCERSEPIRPCDLFFFTKITCRVTCFLRKLHGACESNVNLVNPILFGERSEPTRPYDLFFMKIAFNEIAFHVRVKCKLGESNPFLRAKRAHPTLWLVFFYENYMPCDLFFTKIVWHVWVKRKLDESNPFRQAKRAHPPLWPVFYENCMPCESQM